MSDSADVPFSDACSEKVERTKSETTGGDSTTNSDNQVQKEHHACHDQESKSDTSLDTAHRCCESAKPKETVESNAPVDPVPENLPVCDDDVSITITITDDGQNTCSRTEVLYNFDAVPIQITGAWKEFDSLDNFTRGCKWAPDGTCILTCSNDNILRLFNFPSELWETSFSWGDVKEMEPVLLTHEGGCVYDFTWYPGMVSSSPNTCCFCAAAAKGPVHMWDAFTGELRCSYRPYNHVDEVVTPYSLAFDNGGQFIYCGFKNMIRIFDVCIPGRSCVERPTLVKRHGQSGIISCFAFSDAHPGISAAGSYSKSIGIYSEPSGSLEHVLIGQAGGVTQLSFSPDGTKLFSGGRKDLEILCWDIRYLGNVLFCLRRLCHTNQRMYFDISRSGEYLVSGNNNGVVTVWDITKTPVDVPHSKHPVLEPLHFYQAHSDCVNGISLHPTMPVIATCSGQRTFPVPVDSDDEEQEAMFTSKHITADNSLRLWWASKFE